MNAEQSSLGYFGNVWVNMNYLPKAGDYVKGHIHDFDHVSLLCRGKVKVEITGYPAKEFTSPTFIVIKKEYEHSFTALEDDTLWYCVFALRNDKGELVDVYELENSPYPVLDVPSN